MSKGLDALEKVEDFEIQFGGYDETGEYKNYISLYQTPEYQIIRKELKEGEKNKQALEIIRKYFWLEDFQDSVAFNGILPKALKEEYDLLKEVLL